MINFNENTYKRSISVLNLHADGILLKNCSLIVQVFLIIVRVCEKIVAKLQLNLLFFNKPVFNLGGFIL